MAKMNRRRFFAGLTTGLAGLGLGKYLQAAPGRDNQTGAGSSEAGSEPKIKKYTPLGNTGLKVSDIVCGTGDIFSANVLSYAFDLGVNTFDTAEGYLEGKCESFLGEAFGKTRDKVIIITKHLYSGSFPTDRKSITERLNNSLKRLKSDYVDIAFLHGIDNLDLLKNQELLDTYRQLRKEGKVRFTGFSCHSNMAEILKGCNSPEILEFAQAILLTYNHMEGEPLMPLLADLHKKGVGFLAMKAQAGGQQGRLKPFVKGPVSYPQAALAWVLSNPDIAGALASMNTFSHVEEYVGASGLKLTGATLALLEHYRNEVYNTYCRVGCTACESSCPARVAISEVMRYKMYFEDYGHQKKAIKYYANLSDEKKPLHCATCTGYCNQACLYGLKVKQNLITAGEILSV